jgi:lysophospholipase L1-like esterase
MFSKFSKRFLHASALFFVAALATVIPASAQVVVGNGSSSSGTSSTAAPGRFAPMSFQSWLGDSSPGNAYEGNGPPKTPVTGTAVSGALAGITAYVKLTFVSASGESLTSVEKSQVIPTNSVLTITSPQSFNGNTPNVTGYNVYVAASSGAEVLQNGGTPVTIGTTWQEPNSGLVTGTAVPPTTSTATDLGGTSRAYYNPTFCVNEIRPVFTNSYLTGAGETNIPATTGPITVQWSVEDPNNPGTVLGQGTFRGGNSIVIPWNGWAIGDPLDFDACTTKTIWIRTYFQVASGVYVPLNGLIATQNNFAGIPGFITSDGSTDGNNYRQTAATGTGNNDLLTSGYAWNTNFSFAKSYVPTVVLGQRAITSAAQPAICLDGDSIQWGLQDQNNGGLGYLNRWISASGLPHVELAGSSETMITETTFANYRVRMTLHQFCNYSIVQYGTNDIYTNLVTLAQMKSNAAIVFQRLYNRGIIIMASTVLPTVSTCSPDCSQIANQTLHTVGTDAVRTGWNDYLRTFYTNTAAQNAADPVLKYVSFVIDPALCIEANASNVITIDGRYLYTGVGGGTSYFADGLHPNVAGNQFLSNPATCLSTPASNYFTAAYQGVNWSLGF